MRRASVLNLAAQYHVDAAHTRHVAALALGMFDELAAAGLHEGDPRERELLWAASMLHDIGMSIDYDDHHKHSRYLILNGGLPGFAPVEMAIIAQAARYHRKGMPEARRARAGGAAQGRGPDRGCAVIVRLAEDLERGRDQAVSEVLLRSDGDEIQLHVAAPSESVALPHWSVDRYGDGETFARVFGRKLTVA